MGNQKVAPSKDEQAQAPEALEGKPPQEAHMAEVIRAAGSGSATIWAAPRSRAPWWAMATPPDARRSVGKRPRYYPRGGLVAE